MTLGRARLVLIGLSILGSIAALGAVVSLAYQNADNRFDVAATPLVRVPALPTKLKPDGLLETTSPVARARRGLERLLPEPGAEDALAVGQVGASVEPPFDRAPARLVALAEPAPVAAADGTATVQQQAPPVSMPSADYGPGEYRVQLMAARGEAEAERAWAGLSARFEGIFTGYRVSIEPAQVAAGTVYRVRIGPFETRAAAQATCAKLERERASCFALRVEPGT